MTEKIIDFPKQLYVGVKDKKPFSSDFPLAFATPEGTDSASRKRKNTVNEWVTGYWSNDPYTGFTIDNTPMSGFVVAGWSSRSTTDNKHVSIRDPRGFTLEITIDNIVYLISTSTIREGMIEGEFVWGRKDGQCFLIQATEANKNDREIKVGDAVVTQRGTGTYIGRVNVTDAERHAVARVNPGIVYHAIEYADRYFDNRVDVSLTLKYPKMASLGHPGDAFEGRERYAYSKDHYRVPIIINYLDKQP